MRRKQSVLFLCTGNSCRSQMAEAFLRSFAGDRFDVFSAGTHPASEIHPLALEVMSEIGLDMSGQEPKGVGQFLGKLAVTHLVITCDAANDECPSTFPGVLNRWFWPFDDPAQEAPTPAETRAKFRSVRDQIAERIVDWLKTLAPERAAQQSH